MANFEHAAPDGAESEDTDFLGAEAASVEVRRSPLSRFDLAPLASQASKGGLQVAELPGRTHINIRLPADNRGAANALKRATGMSMPKAGTYSELEEAYIAWLSPDELLLVSEETDSVGVMTELGKKFAKIHHALNDMSSGQTIVRLTGDNAAHVLAKGCTLDLHASVFAAPMCAQTRIAKTQIFLRSIEGRAFDVIVRRSFADYFWTWLTNAAADSKPGIGRL